MYDATEVFAKCPNGCGARMIKCLPNEFICPKCKRVYTLTGERMKHWKKLDEKLASVAIEKCRKVLASGRYKRVKNAGQPFFSLDQKLKTLKICKRIRLLSEAGIETLRDLVRKTADDLFEIDRFGLGCVQQVEKFLAKHGLELGMTQEAITEYAKAGEIAATPAHVPEEKKWIAVSGGPDNMSVALDKSMQAADTLSSSLHEMLGVQIQFREKLTGEVIHLLNAVDPFVSKEKLMKELQNGKE